MQTIDVAGITTARGFLEAAKSLIADPKHWTQGRNKRTVKSGFLGLRRYDQWCSQGAIVEIRDRMESRGVMHPTTIACEAEQIIGAVCKMIYNDIIIGVNDSHGHAQVMEMWDMAIEYAKRMEINHLDFATNVPKEIHEAVQKYALVA